MNKNKVFFSILWLIFLSLVIFLVTTLTSSSNDTGPVQRWGLDIWILHDSRDTFDKFTTSFKQAYPQYLNTRINVESFSDVYTYKNAISSAVYSWSAPDIFVLPSGETSELENLVTAIDPQKVSPNDFRLNYKILFWEELILSDPGDANIEYLKWIPAWYETLGLFYNRKYFLRPSELQTWWDFSKEIKAVWEKYSSIVPLALWNASWVSRVSEIIRTFFALEWIESLVQTPENQIKQVLWLYKAYGDKNGDNRYDILSAPFVSDDDIDFFTQWKVASMIWFPRDLIEINRIWYQRSFLFATPFPSYAGKEKLQLIDYNYFVIHKDTDVYDLAGDFMAYLASDEWQAQFHEVFPYYLPAHLWVESGLLEKKILPDYNIVYKNFIDSSTQIKTYQAWNLNMFDIWIKNILDMDSAYDERFSDMKSYIACSNTKSTSLLNLSSPCVR